MKRALLAVTLVACTPAQTVAGANLTQCILSSVNQDVASGISATQAVANAAARCATDVVTVVTTLDNMQAAADATKPAREKMEHK